VDAKKGNLIAVERRLVVMRNWERGKDIGDGERMNNGPSVISG
jgi:hypothetical protein